MSEPIREASVIVAPPDTCPNDGCKREHVQAYRTEIPGVVLRLRGHYQCPDCRLVWDTTWRIEPR